MSSTRTENLHYNSESDDSIPRIYTVGEITGDVKVILESAFDTIWVEGEVSNYRVAASDHAYFVLKDDTAQISCVLFRHQRCRLKFDPEDGDRVLLFGRITVYEARGNYQVIVETMEPRGLGALQKAFEQLKKKLSKEGLFNDSNKKPLPPMPWKIGIVTSPTGAAISDMIHVISRRNPKISILLYPVKVQGEGSVKEIVEAIADINTLQDIDVLIVGRGGGSIEDLWTFNEESIARAIHASRIPIVSAVGHEIDFTIADLVADLRAPTPSAAAEITVPVLTDIERTLRSLNGNLFSIVFRKISDKKERLTQLTGRRFFRDPMQMVQKPSQRLDEIFHRLVHASMKKIELKREKLYRARQGLIQTSPLRVLPHLKQRLEELNCRLIRASKQSLKMKHERYKNITWRIIRNSPNKTLARQIDQLRSITRTLFRHSPAKLLVMQEETRLDLKRRLARQTFRLVEKQQERLKGAMKNLASLSPMNILQRGYSIATYKGKFIQKSSQVNLGDNIQIRLHKGQLDCTVDDTME